MIRLKTGATRDGTITAVAAELYGDSGAYASLGEKVMTRATTHATGPYAVASAQIDCYAMYTNNAPCGAFRGFGVTQSAFAVESNMDILAHELGMDPIELRRKNGLRVGAVTATGQLLRDSTGLMACLDKVEDSMRHSRVKSNGQAAMPDLPASLFSPFRVGSRMYAWGLAAGYKNTGLGGGAPDKAEAEVEVYTDGTAEIRTSSAEMGQNLVGVLTACTAEELGLPYGDVRVRRDGHRSHPRRRPHHGQPPDLRQRQRRPPGRPHHARAHPGRAGGEVRRAARGRGLPRGPGLRRRAAPAAGAERRNGSRHGRRTGHVASLSFGQAVQTLLAEGHSSRLRYEYWAPKTQPLGTGGDMHVAFSYAVHAALVGVDVETGEVRVERVVTAHDVGRAINRLSLTGQIDGGVVMGLGNALTEHYIEENGVPWTQHLGQYKMPAIHHMPEMEHFIVEDPAAEGPYGAKGVGEISSIPISPAITNAIYNAVGVRCLALPVDQDALLLAMKHGVTELRHAAGEIRQSESTIMSLYVG